MGTTAVKRLHYSQFKRKLFLSFILVLFPPLILMGLLTYWWMSDILSDQVAASYQTMIGSVKDSVDSQFVEMNNFSLQLSQTPWVQKIMCMQGDAIDSSRVTNSNLTDYYNQMQGYTAVNEFISATSLVFPSKHFVVSSRGTANMELYFTELFKLNSISSGQWIDILDNLKDVTLLQPDTLRLPDGSIQTVLTYISRISTPDLVNHATLIVYIRIDKLTNLLNRLHNVPDSSLYILDGSNAVITSVNPNEQLLSGLLKANPKLSSQSSSNIVINQNRYFIFHSESTINDWKYVVAVPYHTIMAKVEFIRNVTIVIAVCLALTGLLLAYGLTVRHYTPLSRLMDTVKNIPTQKHNAVYENEFDFLRKSVLSILSEEDLLRGQFEKQKPIIRNSYLNRLLNGNVDEKEVTAGKLELMDLRFEYRNFAVVMIVLDKIKGVDESFQRSMTLSGDRVGINSWLVELDGSKKAMIINYDDDPGVGDFIRQMKELIESTLEVKCVLGVGKSYPSLARTSNSCKEALVAIDYKLIDDHNDIIYYENLENTSSNLYYYYPTDAEIQIINQLRVADYAQAMNLVGQVVEFNMKGRGFRISCAKSLFYDLLGTAYKVLNSLSVMGLVEINQDEIQSLKTLDDMKNYLGGIYRRICDYIHENKKDENKLLQNNIREYIDSNYSNQNLSLDMLSVAMNISVSHLCKIFKDQFGVSFLDYLNRMRIEKAKELFPGNLTVGQIAKAVGYSNDVTFRRVFKKYEGITPGKASVATDE